MRSGLPDERIAARVQHGDHLHGMWQKAVEVCLELSKQLNAMSDMVAVSRAIRLLGARGTRPERDIPRSPLDLVIHPDFCILRSRE